MSQEILFSQSQPLSVNELKQIFGKAPFAWGLAGGYAIEQCLYHSPKVMHGQIV